MSIASEISRLQTAKANLKTSIEGKGVTVPSATTLNGYPALVDQISGGGSNEPKYDIQNSLGTWLSEIPDLSGLDRTGQVLYMVVDTSKSDTPLYDKVGIRTNIASVVQRGHLSNGSFVADGDPQSTTAGQYWSDTLNNSGERFWIYKITSNSDLTRFDPHDAAGFGAGYNPIVECYGNLPYLTTHSFLSGPSNRNLLIVDILNTKISIAYFTVQPIIKLSGGTMTFATNAFYTNTWLHDIDMSDWNIDASTTFQGMFMSATNLKKIKFGTHNTSNLTSIRNMFNDTQSLNNLDISGLDLSHVTNTLGAFAGMYNLTDIDGWTAIPISYDLSSSKGLTHDSLMKVINSLPTVQTTQTLTLGSNNIARLSAEEIAIATAKGWTVA